MSKEMFTNCEYQKGELVWRKKTKDFYAVVGEPELMIMKCLDVVTSDNGSKREEIPGKGELNNNISCMLFELLQGKYADKHHATPIKTHYVSRSPNDPTECIVKRMAQAIPLEVIVRNQAYGSFARKYGVAEGTKFDRPTFELTLKDDAQNDPIIPWDHVRATGIATEVEIKHMREVALAVNQILIAFFQQIDIELVDFKLVFGRCSEVVGDPTAMRIIGEISPDTCRLRDVKTGKCFDKDIFRQGLPGLKEAYTAVSQKMSALDKRDSWAEYTSELYAKYGDLPK